MIKYLIFCLYVLFLLNIGTYTYYRTETNGKAKLKIRKAAKDGETMTYCLPGLKSTPDSAFKFQERATIHEDIVMTGGITYVYYEDSGFNPKTIAKQIVLDIKEHHYRPIIISVSVGDQIARYLEQEIDDLSIIAINPAPNNECLKCDVLTLLTIKCVIKNFILASIGWLGQLRLIKTDGKTRQSLNLVLDMENCLIRSNLEVTTKATKAVILSQYDKLLENPDVYDIFCHANSNVKIIKVATDHANLSIGSILYRDRIADIFKTVYKLP